MEIIVSSCNLQNKLLQTKLKRDRWFTIYKELSWTRETFMVVKSYSVFI